MKVSCQLLEMAVDQGTMYLVMMAIIGLIMLLASIFFKGNKKGKTAQNFEKSRCLLGQLSVSTVEVSLAVQLFVDLLSFGDQSTVWYNRGLTK